MKFETISVVGLGYIGLPTAAVIASNGIRVIGVDVNQHAVDTINQARSISWSRVWKIWSSRRCRMAT